MRKIINAALVAAALVAAPAAYAQDAEPESDIKITGNVALTSQYRLRGVSQTDEDIALQGGITVAHSSGLYIGTWASNLAGFGTFGGDNLELDLIAGYSTAVGGVTLDGGIVYYVYPGAPGQRDFMDIYAAVSAPLGPVNAKLAAYYAPKDAALGKNDNIWVYTDLALPIADSPVTLKAHVGYTDGALAFNPKRHYIDYSVGADFTYKNLTLNVSWIDTDISGADGDLGYSCAGCKLGRNIVDGAVVGTLTAAF